MIIGLYSTRTWGRWSGEPAADRLREELREGVAHHAVEHAPRLAPPAERLAAMAIGFGEGSEVRTPMAITVIGGLLVSTVLTLVVIPVVYSLMDRKVWKTATGTVTQV
mgnify:CR=1 FL=1